MGRRQRTETKREGLQLAFTALWTIRVKYIQLSNSSMFELLLFLSLYSLCIDCVTINCYCKYNKDELDSVNDDVYHD